MGLLDSSHPIPWVPWDNFLIKKTFIMLALTSMTDSCNRLSFSPFVPLKINLLNSLFYYISHKSYCFLQEQNYRFRILEFRWTVSAWQWVARIYWNTFEFSDTLKVWDFLILIDLNCISLSIMKQRRLSFRVPSVNFHQTNPRQFLIRSF